VQVTAPMTHTRRLTVRASSSGTSGAGTGPGLTYDKDAVMKDPNAANYRLVLAFCTGPRAAIWEGCIRG
jgi:hypothetical protein